MNEKSKVAYIWASEIGCLVMLVAAAYFHNWWSLLFVVLVFMQGDACRKRFNQWFGRID